MITVRDAVRVLVSEHAPHELPVVDGLRQFDDDHAVRVLSGRGTRREPLGFGYTEATALVTSVVWLVLDEAARRGVEVATDSALEKGRSGLSRLLRRGKGVPPRVLDALDAEQLAAVRAHIVERAAAQGMGEQDAQALADGVVARLATGAGTGGPAQP